MSRKLSVGGTPVDSISVRSFNGADLVAVGQSSFTGRYWTGTVSCLCAGHPRATSQLRAGIAAVDWLRCPGSHNEEPAVVTCSDDGSLDVWDVTAGVGTALRHVHGKTAHDALVSGVASSSGRAEVASSSWDKSVKVFDVAAFIECVATLHGHLDIVHSVDWGNPTSLLSASQDRSVKRWDTRQQGVCTCSIPLKAAGLVGRFSHDSRLMGVGDENGNATFWDTRNLREQLACLSLHQDCLRALVFAPQGSNILAATAGDDGRVCLIPAGSPISSDKCQVLTPHSGYVRALAYGQEGKLYSGGWDSAVCCTPT